VARQWLASRGGSSDTGVTRDEDPADSQRPPYGTERSYDGLRLAKALAGQGAEVAGFLMAVRWPAQRPARRCPRAATTWS